MLLSQVNEGRGGRAVQKFITEGVHLSARGNDSDSWREFTEMKNHGDMSKRLVTSLWADLGCMVKEL